MKSQTIYIPNPISRNYTPRPKLTEKPKSRIHIFVETIRNKLLGIALITIGIISAELTGDGTAMMMTLMLGLMAIFSK